MRVYLGIGCDNDIRFTEDKLNCVLRNQDHNCSGPIVAYAESIKPLPQGPLVFRFCKNHEAHIPSWMRKLSAEEMIIIDVMNT